LQKFVSEIQGIAERAGFSDGAYYLAGYTVDCAIKASVAKRTQEHDFPEKGSAKGL
jgi:hypothetical protein